MATLEQLYRDPDKAKQVRRQYRLKKMSEDIEAWHSYYRAASAAYRERYPERIRASSQRYRERHKEKLRAKRLAASDMIRRIKEQPCADCGKSYPHYIMDFDHVRGTKKRMINVDTVRCMGEQTLLDELEKCDLVCSNCHRERTHQRRYGHRVPVK